MVVDTAEVGGRDRLPAIALPRVRASDEENEVADEQGGENEHGTKHEDARRDSPLSGPVVQTASVDGAEFVEVFLTEVLEMGLLLVERGSTIIAVGHTSETALDADKVNSYDGSPSNPAFDTSLRTPHSV